MAQGQKGLRLRVNYVLTPVLHVVLLKFGPSGEADSSIPEVSTIFFATSLPALV